MRLIIKIHYSMLCANWMEKSELKFNYYSHAPIIFPIHSQKMVVRDWEFPLQFTVLLLFRSFQFPTENFSTSNIIFRLWLKFIRSAKWYFLYYLILGKWDARWCWSMIYFVFFEIGLAFSHFRTPTMVIETYSTYF